MANNLKGYDANQVLRSVFDVDKNTLRVSIVEGSSGGGSFEVVISHINDSIRLGNGTDFFTSTYIGPKVGLDVGVINEVDIRDLVFATDKVDISGSSIDVASSALPIGAATEAKQDVGNTSLASINSNQTNGTQSTRITDGTDTAAVTANENLKVADGLRHGGAQAALNLPTANTSVEAKAGGSKLVNRKALIITIQNNGMFWGLTSGVTTANGHPTANNQVLSFAIDPDSTFEVWLVGNANNKNAIITEIP